MTLSNHQQPNLQLPTKVGQIAVPFLLDSLLRMTHPWCALAAVIFSGTPQMSTVHHFSLILHLDKKVHTAHASNVFFPTMTMTFGTSLQGESACLEP
jgi:hypothetical protein